jgi:hypothetical protein
MQGDDTVRFCTHCKLNVYNLSGMSRGQAEELVRSREGRLCARFYRRDDGTVLTRDCPIGLRAVRRQAVRLMAGIAAMVATLTGGLLLARSRSPQDDQSISETSRLRLLSAKGPLSQVANEIEPQFSVVGALLPTCTSDVMREVDRGP